MNKLKRYILFLIGLFVNALGVSLVTKASLGTSPISSIPYVLSLNFPFTLGNFTIVFSILLIVLQILILRKNFKLENILQIPVSIAFGYFIDLTMYMLFWINPQNYFVKMIALLAGCLVLGLGVYLEVLADVVMLPGESFVRAIVQTWNTNFGTTKIVFDSSMAIIAGALSFVFSGKLNGVREGTIIAALLVGFIARLLGKRLEFIKSYLFPEENGEGGQALARIASVEISDKKELLSQCNFRIACDVTNPLCGSQGATYIYGPQKGVTPDILPVLDAGMKNYAEVTAKVIGKDNQNAAGAGAAGGLGFAFLNYLDGELTPGIQLILDAVHIEDEMKDADVVVTGEGRLDHQTAMGKAPVGVAKLGRKYGAKTIAFAGSVTKEAVACNEAGIDAFFPIVRGISTLEEAMDPDTAKANMAAAAEQVFRLL
mgnify:FL=1